MENNFELSMVVLVMGSTGSTVNLEQSLILGFGVVLSVLTITIGFLGLRKENHILMAIFYALGVLEPVYIAYKFYYASTHKKEGNAVYESTFACGVFAFVIWVCLMVATGIYISKGFNRGLKEKIFGDSSNRRPMTPVSTVTTQSQ